MKYVVTVIVVILVLVVGAFVYALTGAYDISALKPHWGVTKWFLGLARDRSIASHSEPVQIPSLTDPAVRREGFKHFQDMCRLCHGAPGIKREEFAMGLYPSPPDLTSGHIQQEWSKSELYWIVRNGIKLTGMPAFAPTHTDEQMRDIVAFVGEVPKIKPQQYHQMVEQLKKEEGHGHGEESGESKSHETGNQNAS